MNQNKDQLMRVIYESGLAAYDAVLFLDTHPCSQEAMAYYQNMININKNAVLEYEQLYGPLSSDRIGYENQWTWVSTPWPWEMEGC